MKISFSSLLFLTLSLSLFHLVSLTELTELSQLAQAQDFSGSEAQASSEDGETSVSVEGSDAKASPAEAADEGATLTPDPTAGAEASTIKTSDESPTLDDGEESPLTPVTEEAPETSKASEASEESEAVEAAEAENKVEKLKEEKVEKVEKAEEEEAVQAEAGAETASREEALVQEAPEEDPKVKDQPKEQDKDQNLAEDQADSQKQKKNSKIRPAWAKEKAAPPKATMTSMENSMENENADLDTIREVNPKSGIQDLSHKISEDSFRSSLQFHFKALTLKPWDYLSFEYALAKKFNIFWAEAFISYSRTTFLTISENLPRSSSKNLYSESRWPRPVDARDQVISVGLGLTARFNFPQSLNLFSISHLYQTTSAYLTYLAVDDEYRSYEYQGQGLRTDYGLHKRLSIRSHLGAKFSYNFAIVKRGKALEDEPLNDRRLYLSWVSLALDYSFYF